MAMIKKKNAMIKKYTVMILKNIEKKKIIT
jgi:hypothetical protein